MMVVVATCLVVWLLLVAPTAHAISWSKLGYATCSSSNPYQRFTVDASATAGEITDSETGRCLTVRDGKLDHPTSGCKYQPGCTEFFGEVVLDSCGGDASKWKLAATVRQSVQYSGASPALSRASPQLYTAVVRRDFTSPRWAPRPPTTAARLGSATA